MRNGIHWLPWIGKSRIENKMADWQSETGGELQQYLNDLLTTKPKETVDWEELMKGERDLSSNPIASAVKSQNRIGHAFLKPTVARQLGQIRPNDSSLQKTSHSSISRDHSSSSIEISEALQLHSEASDEEGVASDEEGVASDEEGVASDEEGVASDEEGVASDEEGVASDEEGVASDEEANKTGEVFESLEGTISKQLCELDETVEEMTNSLTVTQSPKEEETEQAVSEDGYDDSFEAVSDESTCCSDESQDNRHSLGVQTDQPVSMTTFQHPTTGPSTITQCCGGPPPPPPKRASQPPTPGVLDDLMHHHLRFVQQQMNMMNNMVSIVTKSLNTNYKYTSVRSTKKVHLYTHCMCQCYKCLFICSI